MFLPYGRPVVAPTEGCYLLRVCTASKLMFRYVGKRRTLRREEFASRGKGIKRKGFRREHSSPETAPPLSLRDVSPTGSTPALR